MFKKAIRYISHWENWHWFAKYVLIAPAWFWFCMKARSFWFFTPSNPTITFGGFIGEPKQEIYKQLPPGTYPRSIYISPLLPFTALESAIATNHFSFPLAVKPDVGMMGLMFRRIDSREQLRQYHEVMPVNYIIQDLITYPLEVSVFYYRYPNEAKGHVTGFLKKEYLEVVGDGKSNLRKLIRDCPRAQFRIKEMCSKHQSKLNTILPQGERFQLSLALNLSRGGRLVSLEHEKDGQLLNVFDRLSHYSKQFYYGRYDIKCASIDDLKHGRNFSILEYNGCGAEPHHVYNNGNSFLKACKILIDHWKILYEISERNRQSGIRRWSFLEGLRFACKSNRHFKKLKALDATLEFKPEVRLAVMNDLPEATRRDYRLAANE